MNAIDVIAVIVFGYVFGYWTGRIAEIDSEEGLSKRATDAIWWPLRDLWRFVRGTL